MIQVFLCFFLLCLLLAVSVWCWHLMSSFLFNPDRIIYPAREEKSYRYSEVYTGEGSRNIHGWYVVPEKVCNPMVLLVCHGTSGNLSTPFRVDLVRTLSRIGVEIFIFDYRGAGKSPGRITEVSTVEDALTAWNYLVRERKISRDRIIVFGRSLGGAVASRLVSLTDPAILVLESTFVSIMDEAEAIVPLLPRALMGLFLKGRFSVLDNLRNISCPVIFLHGTRDRLVPYKLGVQLFRNFSGTRKIFLPLNGLGHKGFSVDPDLYVNTMLEGLQTFCPVFGQSKVDFES